MTLLGAGNSVVPPIVSSGLLAQYQFDEGSGTTLVDHSGNGNNGTLNASNLPTWVSTGLSFGSTAATWVDLPLAMGPSVGTIQLFLQVQTSDHTQPGQGVIYNDFGSVGNNLMFRDGDALFGVYFTDISIPTTVGNVSQLGNLGVAATFGTPWKVYNNGQPNASNGYLNTNSGSGTWKSGVPTNFRLGFGPFGLYLVGIVYYALFYNRVLSDSEVAQNQRAVTSTLAGRGVLIGNALSALSNQIIHDGDSLTAGVQSSGQGSYPAQMNNMFLNGPVWSNFGVGGETMATALNNRPGVVDPCWGRYFGPNKIIFLSEGTNDIGGGTTGATIYSKTVSYCNGALAAGATAIFVLSLKNVGAWTGAQQTEANNYNASLRADSTTPVSASPTSGGANIVFKGASYLGAGGLIDIQAETNLQTPTNATYFAGDQVHLVNAGYCIEAVDCAIGMVKQGLATLLPITITSVLNPVINGIAFSQTLAATGGLSNPYTVVNLYTWTVSSGTLPNGLSLASSTGVISGTPSGVTTFNFTVTCTDFLGNTGTKNYTGTNASSILGVAIAYYTTNGNVLDSTANGYNMNVGGSPLPTYVNDIINKAIKFVAANSNFATEPTSFDFRNKDFTILMWIKPTSVTSFGAMFSWGTPVIEIGWNGAANTIRSAINNATVAADSTAITNGTKHMLCLTFDSSINQMTFKVDNGSNGSSATSSALSSGGGWTWGCRNFAGQSFFYDGEEAEMLICASATGGGGKLSATQQTNMWNGGAGVSWPFTGVP